MTKVKDRTGERFGKLLVVGFSHRDSRTHWHVKCDCGNTNIVDGGNLKMGRTKSCGCAIYRNRGTHRMSKTVTYTCYSSMKARCYYHGENNYKDYGGRGIRVCQRWLDSFENFYEDMGERPKGMSIERIDNNGDYEPDNCRWATQREQMNNTRRNVALEYKGRTMNMSQWARELGISRACLWKRVDDNLPKESIFTKGKIIKKKEYKSKYTRKFGYKLSELSEKFNVSMSLVAKQSDNEITKRLATMPCV
jgi:hypothetical protein